MTRLPADDDQRQLVSRCLAGDPRGVREFVERFESQVFGLCYRMLGHRQDAEDAAQETFVRAVNSLGRWDGRRPLAPWLLAIAANRCRTALGRRVRQSDSSGALHNVADHRAPDGPGDLAEELAIALAELRHEYRLVFVLFHEQELGYAEIGAVVGRPEGTIKTWLHRARRQLAEILRRRGVVPPRRESCKQDRR